MKRIKFRGEEYLFGGDSLDESGFISKQEDFQNGRVSFAHYFPGQGVMRFREQIGRREDIQILGDGEAEIDFSEVVNNMVLDPKAGGWPL